MQKKYVRVAECAEMLSTSQSTIRRLCDSGELEFWRSNSGPYGQRFVSVDSIRRFGGEEPQTSTERVTLLYKRVSTNKGTQKTSLQNQEIKLREWAKKKCRGFFSFAQ